MKNEFLTEQQQYEANNFIDQEKAVWNYSLLTDGDVSDFQNGTHYALYKKFGSHQIEVMGTKGMYFCVWAPNATKVFVIGDFNDWNKTTHLLTPRWDKSGIWEGFIPNLAFGTVYKYHIIGYQNRITDKGDPLGFFWEVKPRTATITCNLNYDWEDAAWMRTRKKHNSLNAPWSVYEVHLGSWRRPNKDDEHTYLTYDELVTELVPYVKEMGYTHVELMPVTEHPFDGSWGYQTTGYFAATSRYGSPQGFMRLVDAFHQNNIGVILDWVPSHFPYDAHGLYMFDGTHTYEYADMQKGFHPDWNSYVFNYKRGEVKSFLISSARFWFDIYHIDGIRVDAVSSILRLDYSREEGEWTPNEHGGNGNLEAIEFIKHLNMMVYNDFPDVQMIAEEATDWPGVSSPVFTGGLGFGMKWMMGWMHDTLNYFKREESHRPDHQDQFTFSMVYYWDENFMLPISHDEVVDGKSPLLFKMPGDLWQKFANLRLFFTYMWTHPGAKLLFMGSEFGQTSEWNYKSQLDWDLLKYDSHKGAQQCLKTLNKILKQQPALYKEQFSSNGFEWINLNHREEAVIVYKRKCDAVEDDLLIILNMRPMPQYNWVIEVWGKQYTNEIFNSNDAIFGGNGDVFNKDIRTECLDEETQKYRITLNLPPLGGIILK